MTLVLRIAQDLEVGRILAIVGKLLRIERLEKGVLRHSRPLIGLRLARLQVGGPG